MNKLIEQIILDLTIKGEILKSQNLIIDYQISTDMENLSVAPDGVLEYDLQINQVLIPKKSQEYVTLNFKILPSSDLG